jgi:FdhD protein
LHGTTRGVHSAALAPGGRLPASAIDDVGRHNAVDKAIGRALADGTDMASCVLASTGRVSSEILFKARRAGIPVVASFGAPTHQAVLLAREMGVTLVGFARGRRLTAFSHPERIVP